MRYKIYVKTGIILREDGVQIAPGRPIEDPMYVEYIVWCQGGNVPELDFAAPDAFAVVDSKRLRDEYVTALKVTIDDIEFDADETSQQRIARSISTLSDGGIISWVTSTNAVVTVTKDQLQRVLAEAVRLTTIAWTTRFGVEAVIVPTPPEPPVDPAIVTPDP